MGWVPTVETKGSRDLGFSSRAQPPAGQLLWSSPVRPRDCRGEGSRQAPREPQCGLCRRDDEGPEGAGTWVRPERPSRDPRWKAQGL